MYGSILSFDTSKEETMQVLHNSFNWHKHSVTTWQEPRRRWTEKKATAEQILLLVRESFGVTYIDGGVNLLICFVFL